MSTLPPAFETIAAAFADTSREEKLELLLEYADAFTPAPAEVRSGSAPDHVHECMTPVDVFARRAGPAIAFFFDIPPEAPTIRGYAALLSEGMAGLTPADVLQIPADLPLQLGLGQVLSPQRLNGISALLAHIKRLAAANLN